MSNLSKNPLVLNHLDISIHHITEKDVELLNESITDKSENPITAYKYEYGIRVYVEAVIAKSRLELWGNTKQNPEIDTSVERLSTYGYSEQFIKILHQAEVHNCPYILFDKEGAIYDDLKFYDR
jgi:hypothetical protein